MSSKPSSKERPLDIDYRNGPVPDWVERAIDEHLAIEREDAKSAGSLGFMARALVIACMPYKDPKMDAFTRTNGDFRLRIVAGYEGGIPFGIYPRLLMSWVTTEAVRNQSPVIQLGDSLNTFLREVLNLRHTGGERGSGTRVAEQMKRLFGSLVTAQYTGGLNNRGFTLRNVLIADGMHLSAEDERRLEAQLGADAPADGEEGDTKLWTPQELHEAGSWQSHVKLSPEFFKECVSNPVPIDLRAYKALRGSPLAMDIYTWLSYRMSYTLRETRPIRWEALMGQFGSSYSGSEGDVSQAVRNFKKAFLKQLAAVQIVYPEAKVKLHDHGLILQPSRPHVAPAVGVTRSKKLVAGKGSGTLPLFGEDE